MISLIKNSSFVITDSGGIQKEVHGVKSIVSHYEMKLNG